MSTELKNKLLPRLRFPEFKDAGEWEVRKLGEVLFEPKKEPVENPEERELLVVKLHCKGIENTGKYPTVTEKGRPYYIRNKGEILIGRQNFHNGGIGIVEKHNDGKICSNAISSYNVIKDELLFVYYFIARPEYYTRVTHLISGTGQKEISREIFSNLNIFIPSNPEQQKIASCLSSLDEVIAGEQQKLELLKQHKKGLLQNLFPQEGETVPKLRFPEFIDAGEWEKDTLINIASFRRGSFPQPYGLPEWYDNENGLPFIQVFDVDENFKLKLNTKNRISELAAKQSVFIPKGTLIITIQGSIGRVAITQYDAYIDRTLLLFEKFYREIDLTFFAYTIFLLFEIEKQKAPGGIIKTITKEVLSNFIVPIPSLPEQQKIASCLSSLDDLINAQRQKIELLKQHKKGLLQNLFPQAISNYELRIKN